MTVKEFNKNFGIGITEMYVYDSKLLINGFCDSVKKDKAYIVNVYDKKTDKDIQEYKGENIKEIMKEIKADFYIN